VKFTATAARPENVSNTLDRFGHRVIPATNDGVAKVTVTGVQHFVPKPNTTETLLETIHQELTEPAGGELKSGCPTWIRTMTKASKGLCATITPSDRSGEKLTD
jgi:hypothetical protein